MALPYAYAQPSPYADVAVSSGDDAVSVSTLILGAGLGVLAMAVGYIAVTNLSQHEEFQTRIDGLDARLLNYQQALSMLGITNAQEHAALQAQIAARQATAAMQPMFSAVPMTTAVPSIVPSLGAPPTIVDLGSLPTLPGIGGARSRAPSSASAATIAKAVSRELQRSAKTAGRTMRGF